MKVELDNQVVTVGWRYPNPQLEHQMVLHALDPKLLKKMTQPQICLALGIKPKDLPLPAATECIILNNAKEPLIVASVRRFYKDAYCKNKARVFSLSKALGTLYPGKENKELRKKFWDVYNSRTQKKVPEPVPETQEA